jgi:hypothetical protein
MYALGRFDADYRSAEDDSRVLCEGSEFVGPMPSEANAYAYSMPPQWLDQLMSDTASYVAAHIGTVLEAPHIHPGVLREMIERSRLGHAPV